MDPEWDKDPCFFCGGLHWSKDCTVYANCLTRKERVIDTCLWCLEYGHYASECKGGKLCRNCHSEGHHHTLCFKEYPPVPMPTWRPGASEEAVEEASIRLRVVESRRRLAPSCVFCKQQHWPDECMEYKMAEKRKYHMLGRCFKCLQLGRGRAENGGGVNIVRVSLIIGLFVRFDIQRRN